MSEGPIHHERRGRLAPPASTNAKTATHAIGAGARAYCGHRAGTLTSMLPDVTCSACLAALAADEGDAR